MPSVIDCPIVLRQEVAEDHYRISVKAPGIARAAKPGQFAMLQVSGGYAPFLRRPMSIERIVSDGVSFLFKVEGEGTRLLAEMDTGRDLSIQGPWAMASPSTPHTTATFSSQAASAWRRCPRWPNASNETAANPPT